jgi:hypothetical protein
MWKLPLVVGGAVGFVLGSRAGRGPYEQLENRARQLCGRPQAQRVTDQVRESARHVTDQVAESTRQVVDAGAAAASRAAEGGGVAAEEALSSISDRTTETVGKVAEGGPPIRDYDEMTATEITAKLGSLSQADLAEVDAYERKNANRSTITNRVASLRGEEPWPGFDDQTVVEIRKTLAGGDEALARKVQDYERRHKDRQGVLDATDKASL